MSINFAVRPMIFPIGEGGEVHCPNQNAFVQEAGVDALGAAVGGGMEGAEAVDEGTGAPRGLEI